MNQKEKELFFELCRYRDQNPQKLRNLIKKVLRHRQCLDIYFITGWVESHSVF